VTEANRGSGTDALVNRAVRLFEFLGRAQQLREAPPRVVESYRAVLWLAELPDHPAVSAAHRAADPRLDDPVLTVDRVARVDVPEPPEPLAGWLTGWRDPASPPQLRADAPEGLDLAAAGYPEWLADWERWAERERADRPVRTWYGQLFATYVAAGGNSEELELVLGVGCLAWQPPGHPAVRRHVLTVPVSVRFDDDTGRLSVHRVEAADADVELDMLDPGVVPNPRHVEELRAQAVGLAEHPLHRIESGTLVRRVVHTLDAGGEYRDADAAPPPSATATAAFAPAIILRRRSQQGLVEIFTTIVDQLAAAGEVPDGLLPLLDPDHRPVRRQERTEGAVVTVDDDEFLPLPVNDTQLRIIRQADAQAQTLVQGPPGTGKTHTAAALLSHLLAQGKRVLVTAHTDRALREVRDKLPGAIKPLSVAVVGSSREDMSDLKVAVERIAAAATEQDAEAAEAAERGCLAAIEQHRLRRAELRARLVAAREHEVAEHEHAGYRGTLAGISRQLGARRERFGWLPELVDVPADGTLPLRGKEFVEWLGYLRDAELVADEPDATARLVDLGAVPHAAAFGELVAAERAAAEADEKLAALKEHPAFDAVRRVDSAARELLRHRLRELADEADDLSRRREAWMNDALADIRTGRGRLWQGRAQQIGTLVAQADGLVRQLGPLTQVEVDDPAATQRLVQLAQQLHAHLAGGAVKLNPDGTAKIGALTAKPVKQAQPLFDAVRVDGLPPTTAQRVAAFLVWAEATKVLAGLDRAWPAGVGVLPTDAPHDRLDWHRTELDQLHRVLRLGDALEIEQRRIVEAGLPRPDWTDLAAVRAYADLVDVAGAAEAHDTATRPLRALTDTLAGATGHGDSAPCVGELLSAVHQRDHAGYAAAYRRLERLHAARRVLARRDELAARLTEAAPRLAAAIRDSADESTWDDRLAGVEAAWAWAATGTWVLEQSGEDVNAVQAEIGLTEERIRREVEALAASRAWRHAVSPDRLTGAARANLEHYAYLVRRLGKGTGRYAAQRKAEVRHAMDRCRSAVPVWIMPVYRIAEQLQIARDMFDVVIVDEASQAGLEATFLQYLAPRMVVIGDDKQVSPSAVGVDQQQLRDLAEQYLGDDPYRSAWQDPQRSLFDEAKMRFSGLLTLTEHRRCVPEIIAFANRVAYEPDGIKLVPVRQYGSERLDPIRAVYLADGRVEGTTNKVNPVEVDAIVAQVEKCLADPRYDGRTFGVISLLGTAQARAIEKRLLERVAPEDWAARRLQCGDSAAFQGAERDVMFLSMVAAPEPGTRPMPLTREMFVQRYNVAASRARDQMWLFHSIPHTALDNQEDMRFQLLDHCYGVLGRDEPDYRTTTYPEDVLVEPFETLFSQHVANRLITHGYQVMPDHANIDLVVVGARARLGVLCESDTWQGAAAYERELARQRDLQRCGWRFFRVRASEFYVDERRVLDGLVDALETAGIHARA
jgi:very-short-patch-repair endonuclease